MALCGIIVFLIVFHKQTLKEEKLKIRSYAQYFPWDMERLEDAALKCQNIGKISADVLVSLLGESDTDSVAKSFIIRAGWKIRKNLSSLSELRKKQKSQNGILLVESDNRDVVCKITSLPFKGSATIESREIARGKSYINVAPKILEDLLEKSSGKIIIYNLADSPLNLEIRSYTQTGILNYSKKLKTIGSGKKKIFKIKNITQKDGVFHIIPEVENSIYLAYLELPREDGRNYFIKSSKALSKGVIDNVKGILVVSNPSSVPTKFNYAISTKGKKVYQGVEWLMPFSQRIFNVKPYTNDMSSPKIRIETDNLVNEKECTYNEEKKKNECYHSTKGGLVTINYYCMTTKSPKTVKDVDNDELKDIPEYEINDYITPRIPIKCYKSKDSDKDGLCDFEEVAYGLAPNKKDSDNNRVDDGEELFHNFSLPNKNNQKVNEEALQMEVVD